MTFTDAVKLLQEGRLVREEGWGDGVYLELDEDGEHILLFNPFLGKIKYIVHRYDVFSEHWVEYRIGDPPIKFTAH